MRVPLPEDIKNLEKPTSEIIHIRGPGNSAFLIEMLPSRDVYEIRFLMQKFIMLKNRCRYEEPGVSQFIRSGYILTKPIRKYSQMLKKSKIHAKEVDAQHVLEKKNTKQLEFICAPNKIFVTAFKLSTLGYEIESSGIHYFPKYIVGLKKKDRIICDRFLKSMSQLPNVICIYDNIKNELANPPANQSGKIQGKPPAKPPAKAAVKPKLQRTTVKK